MNLRESKGLVLGSLILALMATVGVFAFAYGYTRYGHGFVTSLETNLGEVLMREGIRLEDSGASANAEEIYRQALASKFDGEFNRTFTMKRLGTLVLAQHGPEAALPVLRATAERADAPASVYEPLTIALFDLNQFDEAAQVIAAWLDRAKAEGMSASIALAENFAGRLAEAQGDRASARGHYEAGYALEPHGRNAYALADWHYRAKDYAQALRFANDYLQTGTGERAEYMRDIRKVSAEKLDK
jgi:tetratricopeptide (TPR) repeat protein